MNEASQPNPRQALLDELRRAIVTTLNLDDIDPDAIGENEPLFGAGLDLDSIDALELVVSLEKRYGIKIGSSEESKAALGSINTLAEYIEANRSIA